MTDLSGALPACAPYSPKFSQFHAVFFGNFWQNRRLAPPPGGLAPLPTGNPGFVPVTSQNFSSNLKNYEPILKLVMINSN